VCAGGRTSWSSTPEMLMSKFIDACSRTGLLSATFSTTGKCCRKKHVKKRAMFWMNASSWVEPLRNACGRTRRGSASACGAAARRHGGGPGRRRAGRARARARRGRRSHLRHVHVGHDHGRGRPANADADGGGDLPEERLEMAIVSCRQLTGEVLVDGTDVERADLGEASEDVVPEGGLRQEGVHKRAHEGRFEDVAERDPVQELEQRLRGMQGARTWDERPGGGKLLGEEGSRGGGAAGRRGGQGGAPGRCRRAASTWWSYP